VEAFGFDSFTTILFNMPFGAVQLVATLGSAFAATRYKVKSPFLAGLCVFPIIGISILLGVEYNKQNRGVLLFGYYIRYVLPLCCILIQKADERYSKSTHDQQSICVPKRPVSVLTTSLASVYPAISPLIYSWSGQNTAGDTKRKVTTATLFVGASGKPNCSVTESRVC
jgi:hypothetical protein